MNKIKIDRRDFQEIWERAWSMYKEFKHEQYSEHQQASRAFVHSVFYFLHQKGYKFEIIDQLENDTSSIDDEIQ